MNLIKGSEKPYLIQPRIECAEIIAKAWDSLETMGKLDYLERHKKIFTDRLKDLAYLNQNVPHTSSPLLDLKINQLGTSQELLEIQPEAQGLQTACFFNAWLTYGKVCTILLKTLELESIFEQFALKENEIINLKQETLHQYLTACCHFAGFFAETGNIEAVERLKRYVESAAFSPHIYTINSTQQTNPSLFSYAKQIESEIGVAYAYAGHLDKAKAWLNIFGSSFEKMEWAPHFYKRFYFGFTQNLCSSNKGEIALKELQQRHSQNIHFSDQEKKKMFNPILAFFFEKLALLIKDSKYTTARHFVRDFNKKYPFFERKVTCYFFDQVLNKNKNYFLSNKLTIPNSLLSQKLKIKSKSQEWANKIARMFLRVSLSGQLDLSFYEAYLTMRMEFTKCQPDFKPILTLIKKCDPYLKGKILFEILNYKAKSKKFTFKESSSPETFKKKSSHPKIGNFSSHSLKERLGLIKNPISAAKAFIKMTEIEAVPLKLHMTNLERVTQALIQQLGSLDGSSQAYKQIVEIRTISRLFVEHVQFFAARIQFENFSLKCFLAELTSSRDLRWLTQTAKDNVMKLTEMIKRILFSEIDKRSLEIFKVAQQAMDWDHMPLQKK